MVQYALLIHPSSKTHYRNGRTVSNHWLYQYVAVLSALDYVAYIMGQAGVHPRLEIRDLQQKKEQWTLFIHAMAGIQQHEHRPKASRFADLGQFHFAAYPLLSYFISSQGGSMACRMSAGREYCFPEYLVSHLIVAVVGIQLLPTNFQWELGEVSGYAL